MAKNFFILLLAFFVFLSSITENMAAMANIPVNPNAHLDAYGYTQGTLRPQECSPRCGFRCSKTAYKKPCMFFCQKCCATCLCVPPGTFGNKQMCPCYNNWKTKRGGPKCP